MHNLLFCVHTLCMNYVTNTFLLVSYSARSEQLLCFVHGQGQKSERKHTTKNFVGFHNHSSLLTLFRTKQKVYYMSLETEVTKGCLVNLLILCFYGDLKRKKKLLKE